MIDRLTSLAALGPGLGSFMGSPTDIQDFAKRRVDHLREKVEAGDIDPQKLQDRLLARFGEAAGNVVGSDGRIDFDQLQSLITTQQATKLQERLESWFGDDAQAIVSPDGKIDQAKFNALHTAETLDSLQARLAERFSDRADGVISDDGSIDIDALRELFTYDDHERSYEPAGLRQENRHSTNQDQPFFDLLT